ncbi:MAG: UPF0348 protein [Candidatus Tyloplasma litorale]|nr:MAG: UPF0348 protein [Mycoplasmatales bacterium]
MKKQIIGIIVEFNPLHNGHLKLISKIKNKYPNSIIVAAMSGNFVQRGELAIYNKWDRSQKALEYGIDLVIEIPPFYVLNNANIFAKESVRILYKFNVEKIFFGTESLSIKKIKNIVNSINQNDYKIQKLKEKYHSFPKAFEEFVKNKFNPNDILGICYILEAEKNNINMKFERIKRINNKKYLSASEIRKNIKNNIDLENDLIKSNNKFNIEDYSKILISKLITSNPEDATLKYLKKMAINNKIWSFNELIAKSKNSSYTSSRLRRELIKFTLELRGNFNHIVLATNKKGNEVLKLTNNYYFRHTKENIDNLKVETFINSINDIDIADSLAMSTIKK